MLLVRAVTDHKAISTRSVATAAGVYPPRIRLQQFVSEHDAPPTGVRVLGHSLLPRSPPRSPRRHSAHRLDAHGRCRGRHRQRFGEAFVGALCDCDLKKCGGVSQSDPSANSPVEAGAGQSLSQPAAPPRTYGQCAWAGIHRVGLGPEATRVLDLLFSKPQREDQALRIRCTSTSVHPNCTGKSGRRRRSVSEAAAPAARSVPATDRC